MEYKCKVDAEKKQNKAFAVLKANFSVVLLIT